MTQATIERKHWSEAQTWKGLTAGRVMTAGELMKAFRSELHKVSLCCATFNVQADSERWTRVS
jgi:hypothetical protein